MSTPAHSTEFVSLRTSPRCGASARPSRRRTSRCSASSPRQPKAQSSLPLFPTDGTGYRGEFSRRAPE
eukprot:347641-Pyramimonas_sp.AAC.1